MSWELHTSFKIWMCAGLGGSDIKYPECWDSGVYCYAHACVRVLATNGMCLISSLIGIWYN